jgi:hypothetical protein
LDFAGAPGTFYRDVPYFIKNIKSDGVELTKKLHYRFLQNQQQVEEVIILIQTKNVFMSD